MDTVTVDKDFELIESKYCKSVSDKHRKEFAQFFTPKEIAIFLCHYIISCKREVKKISEPAFGLGVFSRILRDEFGYNNEIVAFEVDDFILQFGRGVEEKYDINIIRKDYLTTWNEPADCYVCNPPYFKFHDYDNLTAIANINDKLKTNLTGFTNIYALFLLKSLSELPPNGRAAYIVPSEFFNADYGVAVKRKMLELNMLKHVVIFHFEEKVFDDALTTSTLLLFENSSNTREVHFYNVNTPSELQTLDGLINDGLSQDCFKSKVFTYDIKALDPKVKWRNYYQDAIIHHSEKLVNVKQFCKVSRGIATGDNNYFSFNKSKAVEFKIKEENLLPCICRAADIDSLFFEMADFERLKDSDKKVFLVDLRLWPDEYTNAYMRLGEEIKTHEKFLTKNRKPWYSIENKRPADIWVAVFNRDGIKFILNETNVLNLTTFHGIYIHPHFLRLKNVIFGYLLTDLSREIFNSNRREYGNGLSKYEPNDFNNCDMFDFTTLNEQEIEYIEQIVKELRVVGKDTLAANTAITRLDEFFRKLI